MGLFTWNRPGGRAPVIYLLLAVLVVVFGHWWGIW
jgi:hypothetical protein